jgi:GT2 family glycosyltransferase
MCNIGIQLARHDWIVKIDGDCIPQPGWLEAYRKHFAPGYLHCGRIEWANEDGTLSPDHRFEGHFEETFLGDPYMAYGGNLGFFRPDVLRLGLFNEEYHGAWGAEDADLGERYRYGAKGAKFLPKAQVRHQYHPDCSVRPLQGENLRRVAERKRGYAAGELPRPASRPFLHILTPHWGKRSPEQTLFPCLEALKAVTLPHHFWVVLQETPSATAATVADILTGESFSLVQSPRNNGLAWPKALVAPQVPPGEYLAMVDDDILVPPDGLEQLWALLAAMPEAGASVLHSSPPPLQVGQFVQEGDRLKPQPTSSDESVVLVEYAGFGCSLIPGEVLQKCQWDSRFFVGGVDLDFSLQLRRAGYKIAVCSAKQATHVRERPEEYLQVRFNPEYIAQAQQLLEEKWNKLGLQISLLSTSSRSPTQALQS